MSKPKTLYITDLDGTFLSKEAKPTRFALDSLKLLKENGVHFTYATARTPLSACKIMQDAAISAPAVMMNGVIVYDVEKSEYISVNYMTDEEYAVNYGILKENDISFCVYALEDGVFKAYFEPLKNAEAKTFYEKRKPDYGAAFTPVDSAAGIKNVFYTTAANSYKNLIAAHEKIENTTCALRSELYGSVYSDYYYLEVSVASSSKKAGAMWLRENCGYERLVGFGDNMNDLPLFEACDENYAVSNAVDKLKASADGVIGSNDEDAVIKKILEMEGLL